MSEIRLNTAAITANRLPVTPPAAGLLEALADLGDHPVVVTRRDLVKAAGVAAAVATGALSAISLEPLATPEVGSRARVAWLRAGGSRALLDPAAFGGTPTLSVSQNGDWRALLTGALFPGTAIPAGLELIVAGTGALSRLRIRHEFGGFAADVPLSSWLSGESKASSQVDLSGLVAPLGAGVSLAFAGRATATLQPDWSLRVEAPGIAQVTGLGGRILADAVTIALAAEGTASLLSRRIARRSLITLEAGGRSWTLPAPAAGARGEVTFEDAAFEALTLEAAETRSGAVHRAFIAHAAREGAATFVPLGRAAARGATPLPLRDVRYARLLDGNGTFHVAAQFAEKPTWVPLASHALLVGSAPWSPPFEMTGSRSGVKITAKPAIKAAVAPFEGAIASPLMFPDESRTTLNVGDRAAGGVKANAILPPGSVIGPITDIPIDIVPFPLNFGTFVEVTRPDDMLTLRFEFYNIALQSTDTGMKFVRENPRKTPWIAVKFPAQHVLEQAIKDPQKVAEQLKAPLKSYLSDESRLVFKVSDERIAAGIPYTLDGLLDWSGFSHRVVPAARRVAPEDDMTQYMRAPAEGDLVDEVPPDTSLEVPWGLILSPYEEEWWSHRKATLTRSGRTELWHTRLHGGFFPVPAGGIGAARQDAAAAAPVVGPGPVVIGPGPIDIIDIGPIDPGVIVGPGDIFVPGLTWVELPPAVRAIWGRLYNLRMENPGSTARTPMPTTGLFRNSFTDGTLADPAGPIDDVGGMGNRWSVIDLSGRFRQEAIDVDNLMLSSLGAWLDSKGTWDIVAAKAAGMPVFGDLTKWDHRATMGRDQYVKIVKVGRLMPFGHRAVVVTITERRVDAATGLAFLGQKSFIVIKEPVKTYAQENARIQRRFPFKTIEIKTKSTPQIDSRAISGVSTGRAFWIKSVDTGSDFRFRLEGKDWDGTVHKFEMPLVFVFDSWASNYSFPPSNGDAAPVLQKCADSVRGVQVEFKGQPVAFAKPSGGGDSARVMPTNWIRFDAQIFSPTTTVGDARYEPFMHQANVKLDAIEELTNQNAGTTIRIADIYRDSGFGGGNAVGKVFAEIVSAPAVGFPAELAGALATPIPKLSGISAVKGTFGGDLANLGSGTFNPAEFFNEAMNPTLMGGIKLMDIFGTALGLDEMPVFRKVVDAADTKTLVVEFDWETEVTEDVLIFLPDANCRLKLHAEVRKSIEDGAAPPTYLVRGELGSFKLHLVKGVFDAIILSFAKITFESKNGASPDVDPQISDVEFGGDLKYLAKLAEYLGALGGGGGSSLAVREPGGVGASETLVEAGPLKIDVTGEGVKASLTIAIPDIAIGVFSLKNMSFYAGLMLPFNGDPVTLDFAFCSREAPFELLVMGFGGGGYVMMTFDPAGMKALEISLEFGAGTSFGIGGIASGSVEIKGGLTIRYERLDVGEKLDFVVFIRIHGELDIMGLISVTLTFYLELRYQTFPKASNPAIKGDKLTGTATLTIEIEILFFTIPVKLSVTKELAGDDPRFAELMPAQSDWDEYCEAFAQAKLGA